MRAIASYFSDQIDFRCVPSSFARMLQAGVFIESKKAELDIWIDGRDR